MPYEYLDDMAIADVAFKAWDLTLDGMFVAAADAELNVLVEELPSIHRVEERAIYLEHEKLDLLLVDFLEELIHYKQTELLLLRVPEVRVTHDQGRFLLEGRGVGERIDPTRHDLCVDVKAVTRHRLSVNQTPHGWEATVSLGI